MTCEEILRILERDVAPVKLSDDFCEKYKMYDNSGIIINTGKEVKGALFSLDLSENAVAQAEERGYNLIVTHHPAIYGGISRIDVTADPKSRAIERSLKCGISVISMHLNFDVAPEGIDYHLMKGVGGDNPKINATITGGGYGRAYEIEPCKLPEFVQKIKRTFSTDRLICHGECDILVKKVASFCGAGCDNSAIAFAKAEGCDVVVSSDMPHHLILEMVESGIAVLQLTHYCAENYGFNKIYQKVKNNLQVPSCYYSDGRFA